MAQLFQQRRFTMNRRSNCSLIIHSFNSSGGNMFAIRLLPPTVDAFNGERFGEIIIDDFREVFSCQLENISELEAQWRDQLLIFINGKSAIILQHDPRFAWVLYAEKENCYIQQHFSNDGSFSDITPRFTTNEGGDCISEWSTSMANICDFVDTIKPIK